MKKSRITYTGSPGRHLSLAVTEDKKRRLLTRAVYHPFSARINSAVVVHVVGNGGLTGTELIAFGTNRIP